MYSTHPRQVIGDAQRAELLENGFLILPGFIPEEELAVLRVEQRQVVRPWSEIRHDPPADRSALVPYPYGNARMARPWLHPELLRLGRWFLKTEAVFAYVGCMIARYPGFMSGDQGHIDNGNNSLLPKPGAGREYGQIGFWIHLDEVTADQAPLRLVRTRDGNDFSKAVPLTCPPGTVCVFNNHTVHASTTFTGSEGQRFTWGFALGRADHPFEGFLSYTNLGLDPTFRAVVGMMTADERTLMRFPAPGHPYYTRETLEALEAQYPGWNARGEYTASDAHRDGARHQSLAATALAGV
ncbi:MAG: phytanoyl-CoA dioxygenase family protein [Planctomycetes bacterium]|nr:phytanoyl-CoA dioxygenase family protein [Planctomycetota bacterium]